MSLTEEEVLNIKKVAKLKGFGLNPIISKDEIYEPYHDWFDWSQKMHGIVIGNFKWERFTSIEKKIAYLQGVLEDDDLCSVSGKDFIVFLNSNEKIEYVKKWMNEINSVKKIVKTLVVKKELIEYHIPITTTVYFDENMMNYIRNYTFDYVQP